jgi:hypothetical protein
MNFGFNSSSAYTLTGAIILIASGAILVFCGFRSVNVLLGVMGFYVGIGIALVVLNTLQANGTTNFPASQKDIIYICIILVVGAILSALFIYLKKVGVILTGSN